MLFHISSHHVPLSLDLPENFFRYAVEILITGHLATALIIVLNPIFQGFEDFRRIPKHFGWQRVVSRSVIILLILFIAACESICSEI